MSPAGPMPPPRPEAPRFDSAQNAWVLSRFPDVCAALREPHLWPVSGKREIQPETRDDAGRLKQRADMLEALSAARVEAWQPRLEALTHSALHQLPSDRQVDLFGDFTLPWGLTLAMLVTGADPADSLRLADLGGRVFAATGESADAALRADAAAATAELERIFESGPIPMGEPAFVALSQTLPRLLANAWLALVQHPGEYARLRAHPELMPGAIEELLRYAGIVRRVFRRATAKIDLGGVSIAEGQLAVLMLASANRDPAQFPDPDRLLLTRPVTSHLSLGTGRNSCVGAMLIRMAASVATAALTATFSEAQFGSVGEWRLVRFLFSGFGVRDITSLLTHFLHSRDLWSRWVDDPSRMGGTMQRKKVVFFFPAFSSQEATAPLGILAVSTPLLQAGYLVKIIDSTITPHFERRVIEELKDAICLAVSLVTGPMIRETVQIAREVKRLYPNMPIVLGGWHPSLLPDQTLAAEYIDAVVVGQGEEALLDVVRRLEAGESLEGIPGVGYKEDGRIRFNPARALRPLREMPPKAYHLADFDAYQRVCGRRWAMYTSSLACPYNCGYCTNDGVYGRKWNALDPQQVVEETTDLVSRYHLELLWIVDDNFLVDRERAVGIAEGLVRRGVKFDWSIQASTNLVIRLTVEELKLLRRAGLTQMSQGADTGSMKMMHLMGKDFQNLDDIYGAAEKLTQAGIRPSFNLIFGYPGEGEKERRESVALMMNICRRYPGAEFWTNIFTPYPGSPIMKRAFELGIEVPKSLEGWADFFPRYTVLPWLKGRDHERLQNMREYMRVAFHRVPIGKYRTPALSRLLFEMVSVPARWRLRHHVYAFPVDLWARKAAQNFLTPPKPKVDAHQLSSEPVTC